MIEKIPPLILRFRFKLIGVVADIKRAFLQISVSPEDQDYLRFMWKDEQGNIVIYKHKRVVFGVVCSPYHLNAVLAYHLTKELEKSKEGVSKYSTSTIETLLNSFYVDNTVTSVDNAVELQTLMCEARSLLAEGKFDLREWEFTDFKLPENDCITN